MSPPLGLAAPGAGRGLPAPGVRALVGRLGVAAGRRVRAFAAGVPVGCAGWRSFGLAGRFLAAAIGLARVVAAVDLAGLVCSGAGASGVGCAAGASLVAGRAPRLSLRRWGRVRGSAPRTSEGRSSGTRQ